MDAAQVGSVGAVLVDSQGRTLYRYTPDGTGKSVCTGECASAWPPLTVAAASTRVTGGSGVDAAALGTITRPGGALQVTYRGEPLYTYVGDSSAGQDSGQGVDGIWFVVAAGRPGTTTTTPTTAGSSGY